MTITTTHEQVFGEAIASRVETHLLALEEAAARRDGREVTWVARQLARLLLASSVPPGADRDRLVALADQAVTRAGKPPRIGGGR